MKYHVMINIRGSWVFRKEGARRAIKNFGSRKASAIRYARLHIRAFGGKLFVHKTNGMVEATQV